MSILYHRFNDYLKWNVILISFFIPISTSLTSIFSLTFLLCFANPNYRKNLRDSLHDPLIWNILFLIILFCFSAMYSLAPATDIIRMLKKMSKLFYLPILLPIFLQKNTRQYALNAFLCAVLLEILIIILKTHNHAINQALTELTFFRNDVGVIFKDRIYMGLFTSFTIFIYLHKFLSKIKLNKNCLLEIIVILTTGYYLFFICEARIGFILCLALCLLCSFQTFHLKGLLFGSIVVGTLFAVLFTYSATFHERQEQILNEIRHYNRENADRGGVSVRIEIMQNTLSLIKQRSFFGWGTGSFQTAYQKDFEGNTRFAHNVTNQHNEYLNITLQLGLFGLCAFFIFFALSNPIVKCLGF